MRSHAFILVLALCMGACQQQKHTLDDLRQGMPYSEARKIILSSGWQADEKIERYREHEPFGQDKRILQRGYAELDYCAGTGSAPCLFDFVDANGRRLKVITEGESDNPGLSRWHIE